MTLDDLERASFWEEKICLDCGAAGPASATECEECGSDALIEAKMGLKLVELLKEGEEG